MKQSKRVAIVGRECVACGCCALACPKGAIQIIKGVVARVTPMNCIGCGKCEKVCPAAVISMIQRVVQP